MDKQQKERLIQMCKSDNSNDVNLAVSIISNYIDSFSPNEILELRNIIRSFHDWVVVDFPIEIYIKLGQTYDFR